ncbi:membrane protein DedA with SNARE-associated domain [Streptomyces fulvorobeus]|uniref:Membrane protein DedA with SNARE-associated domain n=1 Tax=Streptomyces fulvorobeus TaxID=284028 RepID=A0A7Y9L143_9ACTN|nr:membrane protein DedA with SNARE-associated domain [Streptomyces fulvorobeus]
MSDLLNDLLAAVSEMSPVARLALASAFAFAESGLGAGMVVPGEVAVLALSAGTEGTRPLLALFLVVTISSSAGDHIGYFLGIRYGQRMRETRLVRRIGQHHWDRAQELCHRYGASAVFLTRLLPVVRTLTPATAGVGSVRYLRFLPASLAGAAMWSALYVSAGTLVSASLREAESLLSTILWALLGVAAALSLAAVWWRRRHRRRSS